MSFQVENDALRKALVSVAAHSYQKDDIPKIATVMFNVTERDELLVTASGGPTSAVAFVPVEQLDGTLDAFALALKDVRAMLGVFPGDEQMVRFEHDASEMAPTGKPRPVTQEAEEKVRLGQLRITDVSGLIHGKQLRLRPANTGGRDVTKLWHEIAVRRRKLNTVPRRTAVSSKDLGLFKAAAAAYKEPLIVEMGDGAGNLIIRCGPAFVGFLTKSNLDDDTQAEYEAHRKDWNDRLPMRIAAVKNVLTSAMG